MERHSFIFAAVAALVLTCSCSGSHEPVEKAWEEYTTEERLEILRSDASLLAYVDSLAELQFGKGAKCLDFVQHLYSYNGENYLYNEDWGGVLALPEGWIPNEDLWQAEFSFHGTSVWSPDSTVMFSTYSGVCGYDSLTEAKYLTVENLTEDGVFVIQSQKVEKFEMCGCMVDCIVTKARNAENRVNYYSRQIYRDSNGIHYAVSLQYLDGTNYDVDDLMQRVDNFPLAPGSDHLYSDQFTL